MTAETPVQVAGGVFSVAVPQPEEVELPWTPQKAEASPRRSAPCNRQVDHDQLDSFGADRRRGEQWVRSGMFAAYVKDRSRLARG
jgi:hypothetical protein